MHSEAWPFFQDPREQRIHLILLVSFLLHFGAVGIFLIYPLIFKPKPLKIPVITVVKFEKPKVVLRKEKTIKKKPKEKPTPKEDVQKFINKPKILTPERKIPKEIKRDPDTVKVKKVVPEVVKDMTPRMVMEEISDPRLKFWIKMVTKIIQTRWHPPRGIGILGNVEVTVDFTVIRSGNIKNLKIGETSGNRDLDGFALNTVERVGKLPPIPPNFRDKDELDIQFVFHYSGN